MTALSTVETLRDTPSLTLSARARHYLMPREGSA